MFCTSGSGFADYLRGIDITKDYKLMSNMREAIHRNLYNFANSAAMNGLTSSSKIVTIKTWYEKALIGTTATSAVVLGASAIMTVLSTFVFKRKEQN